MKVLLSVSASIAAYKAAILTRLLIKDGHEVKIIMTESAKEFITPLTLSTLSKNPVYSKFSDPDSGEWVNHVSLAHWADVFIMAPLSANELAKMAYGLCDNLLLAAYLSSTCPVYFAPAMDMDMYKHPAVQQNIDILKARGNIIIPPNDGELASGLTGVGRMAEPEEILAELKKKSDNSYPLKGFTFLVTAGPTYEPIDPVRFIGNHSSGKMGFALAERLAETGAHVELVTGPVALEKSHSNIHRTNVNTADEMYDACVTIFSSCRGAILSAAVADYRPEKVSPLKIKKNEQDEDTFPLKLIKNKDILAALGNMKAKNQLLVGFSLETHNEADFAFEKLKKKNCDLMVMNSLRDEGAGFSGDTNKVSIITAAGETFEYPKKMKNEVAADIVEFIIRRYF